VQVAYFPRRNFTALEAGEMRPECPHDPECGSTSGNPLCWISAAGGMRSSELVFLAIASRGVLSRDNLAALYLRSEGQGEGLMRFGYLESFRKSTSLSVLDT